MNERVQFKYIIGVLAIISGAVATFDSSLAPIIRYLVIYLSILLIALVLLHSIYLELDDTSTFDKAKENH